MGSSYEAQEIRYEKGDRVWVLRGGATREPGVIIGHYVDWNLYRIVYTVDLADQSPRAVEEWRLSFRRKGEEHWQANVPAHEGSSTGAGRDPDEAKAPAYPHR
jgi:hypothetical protein